ncbi:hypothetical protein D8804_07085 [Streptococcus oralis]|uniref:CAAX amino terminal protease self-immunity n=1 Tax=Streptococcus oralis TaxID=1303 RepID=A0A3R9MUQ2_STROR|nr:hypothetical protein [Streptococcus oralis]RSK08392.1 hypothetical protein D8804_07085 [Streptococcus oralis]
MMKNTLTVKQKEADQDLNIIAILTILSFIGYALFQKQILDFSHQTEFPIWIRLLFLATLQFCVAGLGTNVVMIRRKESWKQYGLLAKHFLPTLIQTATICLPLLLFLISRGQIHSYLPFQSILIAKEILTSPFPTNVLGFLFTALVWGFWEGFNYVVIANKINCRYPSHHTWLDYGAFTCALICLIIHGMLGLSIHAILESLSVFILIYGMLVIQKKTGNAWGCIFIFLFIWNAF